VQSIASAEISSRQKLDLRHCQTHVCDTAAGEQSDDDEEDKHLLI
jgi:hypothetical protein